MTTKRFIEQATFVVGTTFVGTDKTWMENELYPAGTTPVVPSVGQIVAVQSQGALRWFEVRHVLHGRKWIPKDGGKFDLEYSISVTAYEIDVP